MSVDSSGAVISADGRYVLFATVASNVVPGDTNDVPDVFMYDRVAGTNERVSVGTGGVEANARSGGPGASADGRFVVFDSDADNIVAGDTNGMVDVFVRDRQLGTTERVSVASDGAEGNGSSWLASISADGRYVSFWSRADNLVSGDTNGYDDVFVHDRQTGTTIRVSVASDGSEANGHSHDSSISGDGRYVAFTSMATNLGMIDQNGTGYDVFVHDCWSGTTRGVSVDATGHGGTDPDEIGSMSPRISDDGRYIVFKTYAWSLFPIWGASARKVILYELATGTNTIASLNSSGAPADFWYIRPPSISPDGRYITFESPSSNLAPAPVPYFGGVYVRDRLLGTVEMASVDSNGVMNDGVMTDIGAVECSVSADGRFVAFTSESTNLVPGDTNGLTDVFLRDRGPASVTAFCFGDSSGAPCPCGNGGNLFRGCQNSAGTGGAILWATGHASLGSDNLRITTYGARTTALCVLIQSDLSMVPENYGDGLRCLGGSLKRLFAKSAYNGIIVTPTGTDPTISARSAALGDPIPAGASRYYQVFYRDPSPAYCAIPIGSTFNVSNAIAAVWDP